MLDKLDPSVPPISYVAFWLLMFISFLLGWLLSRWLLKSKYTKKTIDDLPKKDFQAQKNMEHPDATYTAPPNGIKAIQTRGRSGAAILGDDDGLTLRPIQPKKEEHINEPKLNFESFGKADESQKDDLKKISGIGPFIEKKLNSIGIYTFKQIGKFSDDDIETVTSLIEFFPGRIKRDDWKGQAQALTKTEGSQDKEVEENK